MEEQIFTTIRILNKREQIKLMKVLVHELKTHPEFYSEKVRWEEFGSRLEKQTGYDLATLRHYLHLCDTLEYFIDFQPDEEGFSFRGVSAKDDLRSDRLGFLKWVPVQGLVALAGLGVLYLIEKMIPLLRLLLEAGFSGRWRFS